MTVRLAITGTDTGVGKTVVATALAAAAVCSGRRLGVLKPVETGVASGSDPEDASALRAAARTDQQISEVCPYVFPDPVAPLVAARRAGTPLELSRLDQAFGRASAERDAVIVEGAGGWLVPFAPSVTYEALCQRWHLDVVVVVANRLGALNHATLTVRGVETAGLRVAGIVLNTMHPAAPTVAESTNLEVLRETMPHHRFVAFPYVTEPQHIPALVDAARACDLLSVFRES